MLYTEDQNSFIKNIKVIILINSPELRFYYEIEVEQESNIFFCILQYFLLNLYYDLQLIGWSLILALSIYHSYEYQFEISVNPSQLLQIVAIMQISQIGDLIFILLRITSGSLLSTGLQLTGRLVVALYFMDPSLCYCSQRNALIPWSIAEIIRFSYYLSKENQVLKFFRYNAFIVLYPFGIIGELRTINRFIELNKDDQNKVYFSRAVQAILIIGLFVLYSYMLKLRAKNSGGSSGTSKKGVRPTSPTQSRNKRE
ncbi:hypothetical protein pb186bvf_017910 [Paramecium bursaria]